MKVNVEDSELDDPRYARLGVKLGINRHEAFGRSLRVRAYALKTRTADLASDDIDALADMPGFAAALLAVGLAESQGDIAHLLMLESQLEWLRGQDAKRAKANASRGKSPGKSPAMSPRDVPIRVDQSDLDQSGAEREARTLSLPLAPGWTPISGGLSEVAIRERTDLTAKDVENAIAKYVATQIKNGKTSADAIKFDAGLSAWLRNERPSRAHAGRIEPAADADHTEMPSWSK